MVIQGNASMAKPRPSEWGKLNAGQAYGVLSVDLGRAIFGVGWGKYELPIVYYMVEHSWGIARTKRRGETWPDPSPCRLNFNALANEWGMPRQRLYEARDRLKACRFLLEDGDGFWINKDAHEWVNPDSGEPLLSPSMLAYAAKARTRSERSHKQPSVTPECDSVSRSSVTDDGLCDPACHGPACHDVTVQRDNVSRSSVTPHIEDRAQDLEISRLGGVGCGGADTPDDVERFVATLLPTHGWGPSARRACATYPPAWVAEAVQAAHDGNARSWKFVDKVLARFRAQGESDGERAAKAAPPTRASPKRPAKPELTPEERKARDRENHRKVMEMLDGKP